MKDMVEEYRKQLTPEQFEACLAELRIKDEGVKYLFSLINVNYSNLSLSDSYDKIILPQTRLWMGVVLIPYMKRCLRNHVINGVLID